MKLNRLVLSTLVSSSLLSSGLMAADTGTIDFVGSITGTTCDVSINGGSEDATVTLTTAPVSALNAAGNTAGDSTFTLQLTNCSAAGSTRAFFQPGANVTPEKRLANTDGSGAENVTLQLLEGDGTTVIEIGEHTQNSQGYQAISGTTVTLPYTVRYYAEDVATAGAVTSQVTYNISYQ